MIIAETIEQIRDAVESLRQQGKTVGLVPTMGALHQGHMSLVRQARQQCDAVVVTIFVNPTQFGPQEDLEAYPRPFEQDAALCLQAGVDLIFSPSPDEMYGQGGLTWVTVEKLTETLCGESRPTHFRGVTTVCTKLFNIVQPDKAFFGQKDAQQVIVIQRMVQDLNMPLEIVVCPTIRENDGLAVSSRNQYLTPDERKYAPALYQTLQWCEGEVQTGQRQATALIDGMTRQVNRIPGAEIDYIRIVDAQTLGNAEILRDRVLVALAVRLGRARLIDNILVDVGG